MIRFLLLIPATLWIFGLRIFAVFGNMDAQLELGEHYRDGLGVPLDDAKAEMWFRRAAEQGCVGAEEQLARMRRTASKMNAEVQEAEEAHRRLVRERHAKSQRYVMARTHAKMERQLAEQGNVDAQFNLGRMHFMGESVWQSDREAAKWYHRAAEQGHSDAQFELGDAYYSGWGVPKDLSESTKWYYRAAKQENAKAQVNLAMMYAVGDGVAFPNPQKAVKWLHRAAKQRHTPACAALGMAYVSGEGVQQDISEAVKWFRLAADLGDVDGQRFLGEMYLKGIGVSQDYAKALWWYRQAAEQGEVWAQYALGEMYANGEGVTRDDNEALRWYRLAAEQGLAWAKEAVERHRRNAERGDGDARKRESFRGGSSNVDENNGETAQGKEGLDWVASVLGVPREYLAAKGRQAYKQAMMFAHPDRPGGTEEKAKQLHTVRRILEKAGLWE